MRSKIYQIIRYFGYVVGFLLLLFQAYNGITAVKQGKAIIPGIGASLITLGIAIIALACQITAWWVIMKGLRSQKIPLREVYWGYTVSFLPRYIPGTVWGYVSRGNWLKTDFNIDYQTSSVGSFLELALMVLVNTILSVSIFIRNMDLKVFYGFILIILLGAITIYYWQNLKNILRYIISQIRPVYFFISMMLLFFTWILYGLSLFIVTESNKLIHHSGFEGIFLYTAIYSTAWLIGFLVIFVPAGMGIRELALSYLLVMYVSLDPLTANGISIFFRLLISLSELSWLILGFAVKKLP